MSKKTEYVRLAEKLAKMVGGVVKVKDPNYRVSIRTKDGTRVLGLGKWGFAVPESLKMKTKKTWANTGAAKYGVENFPTKEWAAKAKKVARA